MTQNALDFNCDYTPYEFAQQMREHTAADGTLLLKNWYDVHIDDGLLFYDVSAKIEWTEEKMDYLLSEHRKMMSDFDIIAPLYNVLNVSPEAALKLLPDERARATYFIYAVPLRCADRVQLRDEIIGRVGDEPCGCEMVMHAQRVCQLMALNAPELVVRNEKRHLIAAMALYFFGQDVKKVC